MNRQKQRELVRALGRWSLTALVLNSIIGGGIFGLPSIISGLVGTASPMAYLAAATVIAVIIACFAEVASRFRAAGGPYLYAQAAFGRLVGIEVAWLTWLVRLTAAASNANLFVIYLAEFWGHAKDSVPRLAMLTLLIGFLAVVNYRGVRAGARLSNVFAVAKLLPLAAFIGVGLAFVRGGSLTVHSTATSGAWLDAILALIFAFGGFESAMIPMSEARNPRRDAPFALFTALAVTTLVYTLVQVVVTGILSHPEQTDRPLATAAREVLGGPAAALIAIGALVSVYGNLSSTTLVAPRLTFALGERNDFPAFFAAVHPRFRTPYVSIVAYSVLVWTLAVVGSFRWNVNLSAVARLFTYVPTCAALVVLRWKRPVGESFRLPAGPLFALLGVGFSVVLITRMGRVEFAIIALTAAIAMVNWLWARSRVTSRGPGAAEA